MSLKTNQEVLVNTHLKILTLRKSDTTKGVKGEVEELENALALYVRYIRLTNAFKICYDTVIQPQKRIIVERILECLMGRVLELKQTMINLDKKSFRFFDNLTVFKMNPTDLELLVPVWPKSEIEIECFNKCQELLSEIPEVSIEKKVVGFDDCDQAVLLIQRMERARQTRVRIINKMIAMNFSPSFEEEEEPDEINRHGSEAAKQLSEAIKANAEKQELKKKRLAELQSLGMEPYTDKPPSKHLDKLKELQEETRRLQEEKMEAYLEALVTIKEEIHKSEDIMRFAEGLEDEIREWYLDFRERTEGEFPIFPSVEEGGSLAIYNTEFQQSLTKKKDKKGGIAKVHKTKHKEAKIHKRKIAKKKFMKRKVKTPNELRDEERFEYMKSISEFGPALDSACKGFQSWQRHQEDKLKIGISHDENIIKNEKQVEVETEVREEVDEAMRKELDHLKLARDKDVKRAPTAKKKTKKKKKRKKRRKGRGKGKNFETICQSLINDGLIKRYPKIYYKDILGEYNVSGISENEGEFIPFLGDMKLFINELCTLPLCSELIHSKAPFIKSVALVGPPGVSKKTLLYAVCTESNAILVDFSMKTVTQNYQGRAGVRVLMRTVKKFAGLMQPIVLAIHNAEEMFKPKGEFRKVQKRSMFRAVKKFIKWLKRSDRVLVFGISNEPYLCKASKFASIYKKIFYVRPPEYGTRRLLWKDVISKCGAKLDYDFPISILSFLSDGYNKRMMEGVCNMILTPRRVKYIDKYPLELKEFIPFFAEYKPIFRKQAEAFQEYLKKWKTCYFKAQSIDEFKRNIQVGDEDLF